MRMMSGCFTWFPNCLVLGEPNIYQNLGYFTRNWEDCGKCVFYSSSIIPCNHFLSLFFFFSPFFAFFSQPFSNFLKSSTGMFLHTIEVGRPFIKRGQIRNILVYFIHSSLVINITKSIPV